MLGPEDKAMLDAFIAEHPEEANQLRWILDQSSKLTYVSDTELDAAWTGFEAQIDKNERIKTDSPRISRRTWLLVAAAVLIIAAVVSIIQPNKLSYTADQELLHDELVDGSYFVLNNGSNMTPDLEYGVNTRTITLHGEAYLEAKSSDIPMIVKTDQFEIEVLGTRFSVMDYSDDPVSTVTLYEGAIQLRFPDGRKRQLDAGDHICWDKRNEMIIPSRIKAKKPGWIAGKIQFDGTRFTEVFVRLEREFGVEFLGKDQLRGRHFTGQGDLDNLSDILDKISRATVFKFQPTREGQYEIIRKD